MTLKIAWKNLIRVKEHNVKIKTIIVEQIKKN